MTEQRGNSSESLVLAGSLGLLAPHGGRIEPGTEAIAQFVAERTGASLYVYAGQRPAGNRALHLHSHRLRPEARPLLLRFLAHVDAAIAIHGHGRLPRHVYVGGLNEAMVQRFSEFVRPVLSRYDWIVDPGEIPQEIRGRDPNNIVNLPPARGMQLELPKALRRTQAGTETGHREPVGDALVLCRVLVHFLDTEMEAASQQSRALRQPGRTQSLSSPTAPMFHSVQVKAHVLSSQGNDLLPLCQSLLKFCGAEAVPGDIPLIEEKGGAKPGSMDVSALKLVSGQIHVEFQYPVIIGNHFIRIKSCLGRASRAIEVTYH
jgi:phage replication-related protein YjqB (UPF0714/DUF867 family)